MSVTLETAQSISTLFERPVVFVDIETTGMGAQFHEMIEVAALRVEDGKLVSEFTSMVKPRHNRVSPVITGITGIKPEDVVDAPHFEDIAAPLLELFKQNALFVAHNVGFDYSFFTAAYARLDVDFFPERLCTVKLSRALYGRERRHSLGTIIQYHNIDVENRHRAYDDALVMWKFMQIAYNEKGSDAFAEAVARQIDLPQFEHPQLF